MARIAGSDGKVTAEEIQKHSQMLFAKYGYSAVSMRQIAESVGIQASAIYQYFKNKQQLLVFLLRAHMDDLLAAWERQPKKISAVEDLENFVRFHIRYHIERADAVFISYMELRSLEPEGFEIIEKLRRQYESVLKEILKRGAIDGSLYFEDQHVAAMAILSMLTGVNTWYRSGGRLSQQKIENIYASMVMSSVGVSNLGKI